MTVEDVLSTGLLSTLDAAGRQADFDAEFTAGQPAGRRPPTRELPRMNHRQLTAAAEEFFGRPELAGAGCGRWLAVRREIEETGRYRHTAAELQAGAQLAWRNHARCIGRGMWRQLRVIDARDCRTANEVAAACWHHLRYSTNGGRIRPTVTVFRPLEADGGPIRILNPQLVRYAGYAGSDGTILGDPAHVALTSLAQRLGWRVDNPTAFDVLPLLIQVGDREPVVFPVPPDAVLEVPLTHPAFPWFADLGLRWHANPAVSNKCLEIGGLHYPAAPFSGWYVSSEIGARNLTDTDRYNILPVVAEKMGLDTSRTQTLWQDRALIEINAAVLHSYRAAGVTIVDHHQAAQQFVTHIDRERAAGRQTPAEWAWINPPMSGSLTATFHRDFDPIDPAARPDFTPGGPDPGTAQCPWSGHQAGGVIAEPRREGAARCAP